ncbi:MAG: hypothetical protein WBF33_27160 [Candidatus Nitrosopolaris sp.]
MKIAHVIGKAVWDQRGDIRDVISIGKLVRKNDGPEEVKQILSTMTKYGEMKYARTYLEIDVLRPTRLHQNL